MIYVFWNSMEHACINKTSKFETDFLEKKASTIFVASQFLRGTPRYFVFWNFNGIFLYIFPDLHFSMQTHRLIEHTCYPLFEKQSLRKTSVSWESQNSLKVVFKNSKTILVAVLQKDFSSKVISIFYVLMLRTCFIFQRITGYFSSV